MYLLSNCSQEVRSMPCSLNFMERFCPTSGIEYSESTSFAGTHFSGLSTTRTLNWLSPFLPLKVRLVMRDGSVVSIKASEVMESFQWKVQGWSGIRPDYRPEIAQPQNEPSQQSGHSL